MKNTKLSIFAVGMWAMFGWRSDASGSSIDVSGVVLSGDFDGDDAVELVASSPETDCGKGAVYVVTPAGVLTTWTRDTTGVLGTGACDFLFGASLAVGDFDDDGYDDLAVAAPGADDASPTASGSVHVLYGSATGLTESGDQLWTLSTSGVDGTADDEDHFGDALAAGDFNCDGYHDLAIGSPRKLNGVVNVLYGTSGGLTSVNDLMLSGSGGNYGAALAAGNFGGTSCDDLVIAAPTNTVGTVTEAGSVYRFAGGSVGLASTASQTIDQELTGVLDTAEPNDHFGWRLSVAHGDSYDDLLVAVPGDACTSSVGTGRHTFHGSATGITTSDNEITCDTYACAVFEDRILACRSGGPPVYGTATSEVIGVGRGNGIAWGGDGDDILKGEHGNNVLFGGNGEDYFKGGPGRDIIIAGGGDDTIVIDLDCTVTPGEVADGGPGNDTIRSHLSQTQLENLGLTIVSIEQFEQIPEDSRGANACVPGPLDDGPLIRPPVSLSWPNLATPDAVLNTSTGIVSLHLQNTSPNTVVVELEFVLRVRGEELRLEQGPETVAADTTEVITLDLNDFIATTINPSSVDPALLVLPIAASITTRATLTVGSEAAGYSFPPTIFGHLEIASGPPASATAVLYREGALHDTYYNGNLTRWRAGASVDIRDTRIRGYIEAHGSLGIPGY